jgi:hypothetical protein
MMAKVEYVGERKKEEEEEKVKEDETSGRRGELGRTDGSGSFSGMSSLSSLFG